MEHTKLHPVFYTIGGAVTAGLLIWATYDTGPDGMQWFLAGVFFMGIVMNLFRDEEIDKYS